jgi:hypothetical protein
MNSFRTLGGLVARLSLGAALLALAAGAQAAVEKGSAKVVGVQGKAEYSVDGSTWTALKRGEVLREGAVIRTTGAAGADLDLGRNGAALRVMPESVVAFSALTYEETGVETVVNTLIELRSGRVVGHVQKLSSTSKYEVRAPKAVATVRGTRYDLSASGRLVVAEGSVVVVAYREDGSTLTRVVNANEVFSPVSGVVSPATEADLGDVGGSASSIPGIAALPPLQSMVYNWQQYIDRAVLPTGAFVSRSQPKDPASSEHHGAE